MEHQKLVQDLDEESKKNTKLTKHQSALEKEIAALRNDGAAKQAEIDRMSSELVDLRRFKVLS